MDVRECGPTHHACACQLRTLDRLEAEVAHLRAVLAAAGIRMLADGTAWSHDGRLVYDPADDEETA